MDVPRARYALIEGPGGVGKSLTVCRLAADLLEAEDWNLRPDIVFHVDFDLPFMQKARLATILNELIQQGRRWSAAGGRDQFTELLERVKSGSSELEASGFDIRGAETSVGQDVARELVRLITHNKQPRVLFFMDSFEQVEFVDDVAAYSPQRVVRMLADAGANVLAIYASRVFGRPERLPPAQFLRLKQFTVSEADTYLQNEASRAGVKIARGIALQVCQAVGRSPLALRLAVGLIEHGATDFSVRDWGSLARNSPERIQGILYDRLLGRIRSVDLRKMAKPGLLVRRLTAEVIRDVLAEPCRLDFNSTSPEGLMEAARKEGQLFVVKPFDPGALWHRQDVRSTMLDMLDLSTPPELAQTINENAVRYYMGKGADPVFRTEELYHRLRLDQAADLLEPRWFDGAADELRSAREEFPPNARAYWRHRFGAASIELPRKERQGSKDTTEVSVELAIKEYRLLAKKQMQSGEPVDPILTKWKDEGKRLDGPLGDVYAEALFRKGWYEELLLSARDILSGHSQAADPDVLCGVMSVAAAMLEGKSSLSASQTFWIQAVRAADGALAEHILLGCLIGSVRIRRKLKSGLLHREIEFNRALAIVQQQWAAIADRRVLAREAAAELGEALIGPLRLSLSPLEKLMRFVIEANEAFPSALRDRARAKQLAQEFLITDAEESLRNLNSGAMKLMDGGREELKRLVAALRDEVDWSLSNAIVERSGIAFGT